MDSRIRTFQVAADYIRQKIGGYTPLAGIVLGSGLGRLADRIQDPVVIPYKDIPGFPVSTAVGIIEANILSEKHKETSNKHMLYF